MIKKLLAVIAFSVSTAAEAATGNDVLEWLRSPSAGDNLRAYAYIDGAMESESIHLALRMLETSSFDEFKKIRVRYACFPEGLTGAQVFDVVRQHLEANPAERHKMAIIPIRRAFFNAWQCEG